MSTPNQELHRIVSTAIIYKKEESGIESIIKK